MGRKGEEGKGVKHVWGSEREQIRCSKVKIGSNLL